MVQVAQESELKAVRREFAGRYHQWKFRDARRELDQDFPLLRTVRNPSVYRFLEMTEPMPKEERWQLMKALVKRFHNAGLAHVPETITPADQHLIKRYLEYDFGDIAPGVRAKLHFVRGRGQKHLRTQGENLNLATVDRTGIQRAIIARLKGICGETLGQYSGADAYFQKRIGSWTMRTEFGTRSRFRHIDYSHRLISPGGMIVAQGMSLLQWLGIAGETTWQLQGESEIQDAVDALGTMCMHFLSEASHFLQGFEPPRRL